MPHEKFTLMPSPLEPARAKHSAHPCHGPSTGHCARIGAVGWPRAAQRAGVHRHGAHVAPTWEPGKGPRGPEASLCAQPTSGTWHSGHGGGSEAETKQPSPWQCPQCGTGAPSSAGRTGTMSTGGSARGQDTCHVPPEWAQCPYVPCTLNLRALFFVGLRACPALCCSRGLSLEHMCPPWGNPTPRNSANRRHDPNIGPQRSSLPAWLCSWHWMPSPTHRSPTHGWSTWVGPGTGTSGASHCAGCVGETIAIDPHPGAGTMSAASLPQFPYLQPRALCHPPDSPSHSFSPRCMAATRRTWAPSPRMRQPGCG